MEGTRGGNGGRRTKGVECLKSYILGGNGSSASLEVNKRSFGEVIRNIGGHIRRRKFKLEPRVQQEMQGWGAR